VADHQAVGAAGEPAVGEQRDVLAQPLADERRGDGQHLLHARAADRTLVADHDDVALVDLLVLDRVVAGVSLSRRRAPGPCGSGVVAGQLDDAAVRGEGAVEDRQAAGRLERRLDRHDDLLALGLDDRRGRRAIVPPSTFGVEPSIRSRLSSSRVTSETPPAS
jgi:hypothetical protein